MVSKEFVTELRTKGPRNLIIDVRPDGSCEVTLRTQSGLKIGKHYAADKCATVDQAQDAALTWHFVLQQNETQLNLDHMTLAHWEHTIKNAPNDQVLANRDKLSELILVGRRWIPKEGFFEKK